MTDETSRTPMETASDLASLEERLARAEERLSFYTSFDKLIQDNIARSSELMQDALALREQTNAEMRQVRAEMEQVRAEAERAIADAEQRLAAAEAAAEQAAADRRHLGEQLLELHGELLAVQDTTATIARRLGAVLGELGIAEFVPVAWATAPDGAAAAADEPVAPVAEASAVDDDPAAAFLDTAAWSADGTEEELPAVAEAEVAAQDEIDVTAEVAPEAEPVWPADAPVGAWNPLDQPGEEAGGEMIAYSGTGTSELMMAGAAEPEMEATDDGGFPAYPSDDLTAEDVASEWPTEAEAAPDAETAAEDAMAAEVEPEPTVEEATADGQPAEVESFAQTAEETVEGVEAADGEAEPAAASLEGEWPAQEEADAAPAEHDLVAMAEVVAEAAAGEAAEATDQAEPTSDEAGGDLYEPAAYAGGPAPYREEGFLNGYAAEAAEAAVAVEAEPESHAVMVLVHGVPRAAAALSLQRHLAGLPHIEGVEAREYAEGILRLQVTTKRALDLEDLRSWDGGTDLEPVHVQDDVVEVRLPGAHGF